MINTAREISQMIFPLEQDLAFDNILLKSGFNIIKRINNQYEVAHITEVTMPYAILPDEYMHTLLKTIYAPLIDEGFIEDDEILTTKVKRAKKM